MVKKNPVKCILYFPVHTYLPFAMWSLIGNLCSAEKYEKLSTSVFHVPMTNYNAAWCTCKEYLFHTKYFALENANNLNGKHFGIEDAFDIYNLIDTYLADEKKHRREILFKDRLCSPPPLCYKVKLFWSPP